MSYGINAPWGLKPSQYLNGTTWSGQLSEYQIKSGYATSLFTNDPVTQLADGTIGIGVAASSATVGPIIGSFQGVKYMDAQGVFQYSAYWPGGTVTQGAVNAVALVADDYNLLYDMQVATATGTPGPVAAPTLAAADLGQNINFSIVANTYNAVGGVTPAPNTGAGNTRTGQSGYYLDYGSINTTSYLNFKIIRFTPYPGNEPGLIFNNALVLINNGLYKSVGTQGV